MDLVTHFASLSYKNSVLVVVGAALVVHLIFKRTETHQPVYLVLLLICIPAVLTRFFAHHFSSILSGVASTFITFWLTLATSILSYRLSPWHPLAKYPGPLICKVSKFWLGLLALRGKQHTYFLELHEKYGDIVRVGPNELSIRDLAAVTPIMGPAGLPKGPFWDGRVPETDKVKPMIALRDKQEHTRRRRPWTRAFNTAALKGYEAIITKRCLQLVETLGNKTGIVDLTERISFFTYDSMNDLAFGGGTDMLGDGDVDGLWHLLEAGQVASLFLSHLPWLGGLCLRLPGFAQDVKKFRAHAKKQGLIRREKGSSHKDIFHHLIDEDGVAPNPPTLAEAVSDGALAIVAGADATSSGILNLFFFLLTNPTKYKRLQAEIDEFGNDATDYGKQVNMPYLNAAINESLRLFPPLLSGSQRYTNKGSGGRNIGPHYIPEGTTTFIPFFVMHRDPRYFAPLTDAFIPERWLPVEKQIELEPALFKDQSNVILNTNAFLPFSTGPSNCVGKNLAWMEMRMAVCLIMQRFDMKLEDGYRVEGWEEAILDYFVMVKGKLPVILTPRK